MFTLLSWYYYTSELKPCRRKIDPRCLIQINNLHCYTIFCFASYCAVLFVCFIVYSIRRIVIPKSELEYWIVCRITMAQSFMGTTVALRDADFHIRCDFCSICVQSTLPLFYVNPANIVLLSVLRKCIRLNGILWLRATSDLRAVLLLLFYSLLFTIAKECLICFICFWVSDLYSVVTTHCSQSEFLPIQLSIKLETPMWHSLAIHFAILSKCGRFMFESNKWFSDFEQQYQIGNLESIKDHSPLNNN